MRIVISMNMKGHGIPIDAISGMNRGMEEPIEKWRTFILAKLDAQYASFRDRVEDRLSQDVPDGQRAIQ